VAGGNDGNNGGGLGVSGRIDIVCARESLVVKEGEHGRLKSRMGSSEAGNQADLTQERLATT
jgi:hypothetical protein